MLYPIELLGLLQRGGMLTGTSDFVMRLPPQP